MNWIKRLLGITPSQTQTTEESRTKIRVESAKTNPPRVRLEKEEHPQVPNDSRRATKKTYTAPDKAAAFEFLSAQVIKEPFYYMEVRTPEGLFGIDNGGFIYNGFGDQVSSSDYPPSAKKMKANLSLIEAADIGQLLVAEQAIKDGASLECSGGSAQGTPLIIAAYQGNLSIVELLIKCKCDLNAKNVAGNTALMLAVLMQRVKIVEVLVAAGADLRVRDRSGQSVLEHEVESPEIRRILDSVTGKKSSLH